LCFFLRINKKFDDKIVVEDKQASLKKRKLNIIDEDHEESEGKEHITPVPLSKLSLLLWWS